VFERVVEVRTVGRWMLRAPADACVSSGSTFRTEASDRQEQARLLLMARGSRATGGESAPVAVPFLWMVARRNQTPAADGQPFLISSSKASGSLLDAARIPAAAPSVSRSVKVSHDAATGVCDVMLGLIAVDWLT